MGPQPELPRGTVTFLFTDIEGSTRLLKQLGGRYGDLLAQHQHLLRTAFAEHGGREIDTQGDSFFVAFARAKDAVAAAAAAQRAIADAAWPDGVGVRVRMGLHTGEPLVGEERYIGLAVHRAARICAAGHGGQLLVSQTTRELLRDDPLPDLSLRDLGEHGLKDLDERERIYQVGGPGLAESFPPLKSSASMPFAAREAELVEAAQKILEQTVGREAELAAVERFLAAVAAGPATVVIEGEAGIGKTTIWKVAVARARERLFWVLTCTPAEVEATMSFAALGDLFEPVLSDTLQRLPPPQARALEVALLLADADGPPPEPRVVAVASLNVLRALAAVAPVVVAIDDVQWLDPPSAQAIGFALRRLETEPVGLLVAHRNDESLPAAHGTPSVELELDARERISVAPLTATALDRIIRAQLGTGFTPPTLHKLRRTSGGNPFFALEIARALLRSDTEVAPGQPLPVPRDLTELVQARLSPLSEATKAGLLAAAALSRPTTSIVAAAAGGADLEEAQAAGVIAVDAERIRFTHPLLPSVLYSWTPRPRRHLLHRRLAALVEDPEERARHLALAAEGPEEEVAAALEVAAAAARARGAPETAADLAEQAWRLTPVDRLADMQRRKIGAAEHLLQCGDLTRARMLAEQAVSALEPGALRARALLTLAITQAHELNDWEQSYATEEQALREVGDDDRLRAEVERQLGWAYAATHRAREAEPHVRTALELAEGLEDRLLLAEALAAFASVEFQLGRGFRRDVIDRALALDTLYDHPRVFRHPNWPLYTLLYWTSDMGGARSCIETLMRVADERGEENASPWLLEKLAGIELAVGNWPTALRHADAAHAAAIQTGQEAPRRNAAGIRAWIDALHGKIDPARRIAEELLASDDEGTQIEARMLLGFIELSLQNVQAAADHLIPLLSETTRHGVADPSIFPFRPDLIEALIGSDDAEQANDVLEWLEERGRMLDRPWALATAGRCRGLSYGARGRVAEAVAAFDSALVEHERLPMPFERARTLLAYGTTLRRFERERQAREPLSEALAILDGLGAELWADMARAELTAVDGPASVAPNADTRP